jgi:hypothetical protein
MSLALAVVSGHLLHPGGFPGFCWRQHRRHGCLGSGKGLLEASELERDDQNVGEHREEDDEVVMGARFWTSRLHTGLQTHRTLDGFH